MDNAGFIAAGYLLTAAGLGGYAWYLLWRARRATRQAAAILANRNG